MKDENSNDLHEENWLAEPDPLPREPENQAPPGATRRGSRRLLAVLFIAAAVGISMLYVNFRGDTFPSLPPGAYVGALDRLYESPVALYVERKSTEADVVAWLFRPNSELQNIEAASLREKKAGFSGPLRLRDGEDVILLKGTELNDTQFGGEAERVGEEKRGTWRLTRITPPRINSAASANERLWLLMKANLEEVNRKLSEAEHKLPEQKKEIQRLQDFVSSKEGLKANADRKYVEEKAKAEKLKATLVQKQDDVEKLQKKVELAYRVTDMGKLVSLSRESLARDAIWLSAMLAGNMHEASPELNEAYEKAERILTVQRQIDAEQQRIDLLSRRYQPVSDESGQ